MNKLSWRFKLGMLFVLVLGISLLFQLFYIIPYIRGWELNQAKRHQEIIARNIARELDMDLTGTIGRIIALSKRPEFRSMDTVAQQHIITMYAEGSARLSSLSVMDADGRFVVSNIANFFTTHTSNKSLVSFIIS